MCIAQTIIFGVSGAYLTSVGATDPTTQINPRPASILGVVYTVLGLLFAAIAGGDNEGSVMDKLESIWGGFRGLLALAARVLLRPFS